MITDSGDSLVSIESLWLPRPFDRIWIWESPLVTRLLHACARLRTVLKVVVQDEELKFPIQEHRLDTHLSSIGGEVVSVVRLALRSRRSIPLRSAASVRLTTRPECAMISVACHP